MTYNGAEPTEDQLEERDEVVFKNGAVYKGQWFSTMKHGFGV